LPVMFFRPQALESIARKLLVEYDASYLNRSPRPVPIETIIEKVCGLSIEYKYLTNNGRELGRMIYDDGITTYFDKDINEYALMTVQGGTIMIDASLLDQEKLYGRLRFTLAHELSHYLLHKGLYSGTGTAAALYKHEINEDATEWQANYLAQAILMPKGQVKRCFYALRPTFKSKQESISQMAKTFEVSKQAMEIRLKRFALI
jgi:hypothetical protein